MKLKEWHEELLEIMEDIECCDLLGWRVYPDSIDFYIVDDDVRMQGFVYSHFVYEDDLPLLKQCVSDLREINECNDVYAPCLFLCIKGNIFPQDKLKESYGESVWKLFEKLIK